MIINEKEVEMNKEEGMNKVSRPIRVNVISRETFLLLLCQMINLNLQRA